MYQKQQCLGGTTKINGIGYTFAIMEGKGLTMSENDEKIACHVCKKVIPKATAVHAEGEEYVLHFCNLDCLNYWKKEKKEKAPETKK